MTDLGGRGAVVVGGSRGIGALDPAAPEYAAPIYAYLASDLSRDVSGEIFIAAGGFIGRFDRPSPQPIGYRDHHTAPPWSLGEISEMLSANAS